LYVTGNFIREPVPERASLNLLEIIFLASTSDVKSFVPQPAPINSHVLILVVPVRLEQAKIIWVYVVLPFADYVTGDTADGVAAD
jgi:hypothetical protein